MQSFAAVVVVYNTTCQASLTCQALLDQNYENLTVLIYDNSTRDFGNKQFCEANGWKFLGGKGNVGLSKAYNESITYLKKFTKVEYVCLFDDDTKIDETYFSLLKHSIQQSNERIFVPIIYSAGLILSPSILEQGHRFIRFGSEQEALSYKGDKITAINSCMALNLSLFDHYAYDENIFLDGIDHNFIADMKNQGEHVKVFPYTCEHEFSGDAKPSKASAMNRFLILKKDFRYILKDRNLTYLRLIGKRALKLSLQYRSMDFIKQFLK